MKGSPGSEGWACWRRCAAGVERPVEKRCGVEVREWVGRGRHQLGVIDKVSITTSKQTYIAPLPSLLLDVTED
jgi:hypothetical protein